MAGIDSITVDTMVYAYYDNGNKTVERRCTAATLPAGLTSSKLIISHQEAKGNKPDRHLIKWVDTVTDSVTGATRDYVSYSVHQVPKGGTPTEIQDVMSETGTIPSSLAKRMSLLVGTGGFVSSVITGGYS